MTANSRIWTISNVLTTIRILLIPFFFWTCFHRFRFHPTEFSGFYPVFTVILFVFIVASDWLDGFLARRLGQQTSLGAFLDPLADKLLVTTSFVLFAALDKFPPWLAIAVVSRDLILFLGWCLLFVMQYDTSIRPWMVGKIAAVLQFACIGGALVPVNYGVELSLWSLAVLFTVVAAICYIYEGLRRATPKHRGKPAPGMEDDRRRSSVPPHDGTQAPDSDSEKGL